MYKKDKKKTLQREGKKKKPKHNPQDKYIHPDAKNSTPQKALKVLSLKWGGFV